MAKVGQSLQLREPIQRQHFQARQGFDHARISEPANAVCADLVINKPLKLSPSYVEFKRAHLYNLNPVGFGSMALSPLIAWLTKGKYYIARTDDLDPPVFTDDGLLSAAELDCVVCGDAFERPDMSGCPHHSGAICSLCCSLEKACHDSCKKTVSLGMPTGNPR